MANTRVLGILIPLWHLGVTEVRPISALYFESSRDMIRNEEGLLTR